MINLADGFQYLSKKPLDSRLKFDTVADMASVAVTSLYDGCFAYVTATKKYYSFDSTNDTDPTLGKWKEFEPGGGTSVPSGGTTGQALVKHSNTDGDVEWATVGGGGSYTAGDGIDITNNEISVKVDGDSITIDEYGVLHASGGGGGVKLTDVTGANVSMNRKVASITWTDPPDVVISGATLAEWDGTKVLVKQGSAPANTTDGTVVIDETGIRSQYASTPLTYSNLEYDTMYYFRFFPYTTEGAETRGTAISVTPVRDVIPYVPSTSSVLTYDGTAQSPTWQNYDSTKMTMSGDTEGTNAGSYTTVFTPLPDYKWDDGTTEAKSVTWSIGKAEGGATVSANSVTLDPQNLTDTITITASTGEVTGVTSSDTTVATVSVSGSTITISSVDGTTGTATISIAVAASANYNAATTTIAVTCDFVPALEDATWAEVSATSAAGLASSYWSVGDTKSVHLQGNVGSTCTLDETLYVFILGFDHNSTLEGTGISFGCFKTAATDGYDIALVSSDYNYYASSGNYDGTKTFNMEHWGVMSSGQANNKTYGGWKGCDTRYDILGSTDRQPSGYGSEATTSRVGYDASQTTATNPVPNTLMAALPQDLRAVMKPITKYTDNSVTLNGAASNVTASIDYLPLLGAYETVRPTSSYINTNEETYQQRYAYYVNGNSTLKKGKINNNYSNIYWWMRSPMSYSGYEGYRKFVSVSVYGNPPKPDSSDSCVKLGLSPVFLV